MRGVVVRGGRSQENNVGVIWSSGSSASAFERIAQVFFTEMFSGVGCEPSAQFVDSLGGEGKADGVGVSTKAVKISWQLSMASSRWKLAIGAARSRTLPGPHA